MLDERQAFKFGFLLRCADEGLTPEQTAGRIKAAGERLARVKAAGWGDAVASLAGNIPKIFTNLGMLGVGASALGGAGAGIGLAHLTGGEADPEETKRQELIAAYQQQADRIRRSTLARRYRDRGNKPRKPSLGL